MTNPYHDQNGRFCSKEEMGAIVEQLGKAVANQQLGRGKALSNGERDAAVFDRWVEMKRAYEAATSAETFDRLPTGAELKAVRHQVAQRREAARERQREAVKNLMDFGHTINSDGKGNVVDKGYGNSPMVEETQYVELTDGSSAQEPVAPAGWEYLTGFTGQQGYNGAIMHESEFIGGKLADHILENPGFYTSVEICTIPEAGWMTSDEYGNLDGPYATEEEAISEGAGQYVHQETQNL